MPKIYFIIVTYNAMKWAEKCFSSLRKSSVVLHCIVIDNGSTDGTQDFIKNNYPEVDFTQSTKNLGFGKANNIGIEKAYKKGADFFYLMNQDAWLFEDTIQNLLEAYDGYCEKKEIGIISPMHLDGSEKRLDLHFENYIAQDSKNSRILSDIFLQQPNSVYETKFVNAAHWFIPRSTIEKVGGFNPYFFYGAEDYEYINRLSYLMLKVIISTKSKVVHDAVQSFHKLEPKTKDEVLKQKRLSMTMQLETKYLDPGFDFNRTREKKSFLSYILKMALQRNMSELKFYLGQYKYFSQKFDEIEEMRKKSITEKSPFLHLEPTSN